MTILTLFLVVSIFGEISSEIVHTIQMPVSDVPEDDTYMCFRTPMGDYSGLSLVGYEIESVKGVAHHAVLLACEDVNSDKDYWDCSKQQGHISKGRAIGLHGKEGADIEHIRLDFPEDVGIVLGSEFKINYMVLQVHYKQKYIAHSDDSPSTNVTMFLSEKRQKYTRQTSLMASEGYIPGNTERYSSELITRWSGVPVVVDTFSIHTHNYGLMVESYIIKDDVISVIGRHSPQHHGTAVYKMPYDKPLLISPGDIVVARCVYRNPNKEPIIFGKGIDDEMCNFSLNFKVPTESTLTYPRTVVTSQNTQEIIYGAVSKGSTDKFYENKFEMEHIQDYP